MGVFSFLGWIFTPKKKMREVMSNPQHYKDYVTSKGYSEEEQIEFCERFGIDYEKVTSSPSIPSKEIKKRAINDWEKKLTVLWAGEEQPITILYEDSDGNVSVRKVTPEQVLFSKTAEFYIRGLCHRSQEQRTFNVGAIQRISDEDGTETDFYSWCISKLNIDPFTAVPEGRLPNFYQILWKGTCPPTSFTYRNNGRKRITVVPTLLRKRGTYYDLVAKDESEQLDVFLVQNIETMLTTDGYKKMHFDDWVKEVLVTENVCS